MSTKEDLKTILKMSAIIDAMAWAKWVEDNNKGYLFEDSEDAIRVKLKDKFAQIIFGFSVDENGDTFIAVLDEDPLLFMQYLNWDKVTLYKKDNTIELSIKPFVSESKDTPYYFSIILNIHEYLLEIIEEDKDNEIQMIYFYREKGKIEISEKSFANIKVEVIS